MDAWLIKDIERQVQEERSRQPPDDQSEPDLSVVGKVFATLGCLGCLTFAGLSFAILTYFPSHSNPKQSPNDQTPAAAKPGLEQIVEDQKKDNTADEPGYARAFGSITAAEKKLYQIMSIEMQGRLDYSEVEPEFEPAYNAKRGFIFLFDSAIDDIIAKDNLKLKYEMLDKLQLVVALYVPDHETILQEYDSEENQGSYDKGRFNISLEELKIKKHHMIPQEKSEFERFEGSAQSIYLGIENAKRRIHGELE